jgi:hypothetical protein
MGDGGREPLECAIPSGIRKPDCCEGEGWGDGEGVRW